MEAGHPAYWAAPVSWDKIFLVFIWEKNHPASLARVGHVIILAPNVKIRTRTMFSALW